MLYVQLNEDNRIIAWTDSADELDPNIWIQSPWDSVPHDFSDWLLIDGELIHDPRNLPPVPFDAAQVLSAIFTASPETMDALPDEALARMAPYMQAWEPDTDYHAGDKRRYNELPYRCLQDHRAQDTWNPEDAPSLWARILIPDPETIPEWAQPGSTNPYMKGDKVRHNGQVWISDLDNNIWEPGVYGWTVVD